MSGSTCTSLLVQVGKSLIVMATKAMKNQKAARPPNPSRGTSSTPPTAKKERRLWKKNILKGIPSSFYKPNALKTMELKEKDTKKNPKPKQTKATKLTDTEDEPKQTKATELKNHRAGGEGDDRKQLSW